MKDPVITVEYTLPCGHKLRQGNRLSGELHTHADHTSFIESSANVLAHWFKARGPMHRCELVTEDNPMGLLPREKQP